MSDEKIEKIAGKADDLKKQVASIAFTVRKIKDKLEEQFGMDIDGDGRVGSGPFKKALMFLLVLGMSTACMAEDKAVLAWWRTNAYVDGTGRVWAASFYSGGTQLTNGMVAGQVLPAVDASAVTNITGNNIVSNIPIAAITNALASSGSTIKGNIPVASITNALTTGGASIGGNIPIAAMTNASGAAGLITFTNSYGNMTNIITVIGLSTVAP